MSLFTPQINNTIKELLKELEHLPNFCEKICEKVNKQYATNFTLNQVRQYLKDELHVKIPQNRGNPFTDQIDNSIKEFMKKFGQSSNPYVKVSQNINKLYNTYYTSKQIRQRWISRLNTNLCIVPLSKDEKSFIVQWVERGDTIPWKELIPLMETKFKKLRSENIVKNFWYLRKSTPESTKSKAENKYSRKRSPKLKAKIEKQQKKVCHGLTTFESSPPNGDSNAKPMDTLPKSEENIIHLPLLNARPMEISFKSKERTNSPRLNARQMETSFKSKERIHLPLLNASPMEISFQSKGRIHLPPLNASPMEISFQSKGRIRLPPLNARPMEISFENEENTPPSNRMEILCWATAEAYKRDYPTK
ncbi:unnamed protein product [Rhizophagus irregularis]|nr:unnamed protein product [Rhizophagus irregularis]CAB4431343.1 unnamed protein product [Rhizophagus irregularis]